MASSPAPRPLQIALRTYALSLSLSLGPSLVPLILSLVSSKASWSQNVSRLKAVLRRELGLGGFAFAMTTAVSGGCAFQYLWKTLERLKADDSSGLIIHDGRPGKMSSQREGPLAQPFLPPWHITFISNLVSSSVAIHLLHWGIVRSAVPLNPVSDDVPIPYMPPFRGTSQSDRVSSTLDLTLLFLVRAVDALIQSEIWKRTQRTHHPPSGASPAIVEDSLGIHPVHSVGDWREKMIARIDALVFWACSARIMWCFAYKPASLPKSYLKWISALADVDPRLLSLLRALQDGKWSYVTGSPTHADILKPLAQELGYPQTWADPAVLPAHGGGVANEVWKRLVVTTRAGVGGLPCEIIHAGAGKKFGFGQGCLGNASARMLQAFLQAVTIYSPVYLVSALLTRPRSLLRISSIRRSLFAMLRSSLFLSTFVSSFWLTVCLSRTLLLPRLLPQVSHDFWDGPYGCVLLGSMMCPTSVCVERVNRRGEIALYVAPRALRTWLPDRWLRNQRRSIRLGERLVFILSLSWLLTTALHRPHVLRGLSGWAMAFIMSGPKAGLWARTRRDSRFASDSQLDDTNGNREQG